jgi:hypothetical protein
MFDDKGGIYFLIIYFFGGGKWEVGEGGVRPFSNLFTIIIIIIIIII